MMAYRTIPGCPPDHIIIKNLRAQLADMTGAYELCKKGANDQFMRDTKTLDDLHARIAKDRFIIKYLETKVTDLESAFPEEIK
jgi:hypothetical protein